MLDGAGDMHVGGWWIAGMVLMVVFWAAVIWLGYVLVRRARPSDRGGAGGGGEAGDAVAILRARYARGEIDGEEFSVRLERLRHH